MWKLLFEHLHSMDMKNVHLEQKCETPISSYSERVTWETERDWRVLRRSIELQQIILVADHSALVDTFLESEWDGNITLSLKPKTNPSPHLSTINIFLKGLFKNLFENRKVIHLLISHHSNRIKIENWFLSNAGLASSFCFGSQFTMPCLNTPLRKFS